MEGNGECILPAMAANLTAQYKEAEEAYRKAGDPQEKLACLERMLRLIPKHKGTEKMQADLKKRIAAARQSAEKSSGKRGWSVRVEPEGVAQCVLIGGPNAGKSTLVEATTNARVEVGDHPFSTREPVPAILAWEDLQFQLVDLPPVSAEHMEHWVTDIIRTADLGIWVVDASTDHPELPMKEVRGVLADRKITLDPEPRDSTGGQEATRRLPTILIASKTDSSSKVSMDRLRAEADGFTILPLSALGDSDFSSLPLALFELARIVRVYAKSPGKEADRAKPFVLRCGDTVIDFAGTVHKDLAQKFKFARIWGSEAFDGQRVARDHVLQDGDVVEVHT